MKVIVAHPGKQHSLKTAEAFFREDTLFKYITTVYNKPNSYTYYISKILSGDNKKKSASRKTKAIPNEKIIQFNELAGILIIFLLRFPFLRSIYLYLNEKLQDSFGKKVANYAIKNNVDAVIMYDSTANKCWEILKDKAPHIKRILDMSIANRLFMKENFIKDMQQTKSDNLKKEQFHLWNTKNIKRFKKEFDDSHHFLVASSMVKKSLLFSNITDDNISIIPYGVDSSNFKFIKKQAVKKPLQLIYVGEISYRKGMHHLLKLIAEMNPDDVALKICGRFNADSELYMTYNKVRNIKFLGFVTRDILALEYQKSDVFVFPTLGEGYGLVILEALSCGVPCIVSNLAGGDDAIEDGYNGFIFKGGDNKELKDKIQWLLNNPNKLPEMSLNSKLSIENYTWDSYFDKTYRVVERIVRLNDE